jgi:hypothetical protein
MNGVVVKKMQSLLLQTIGQMEAAIVESKPDVSALTRAITLCWAAYDVLEREGRTLQPPARVSSGVIATQCSRLLRRAQEAEQARQQEHRYEGYEQDL